MERIPIIGKARSRIRRISDPNYWERCEIESGMRKARSHYDSHVELRDYIERHTSNNALIETCTITSLLVEWCNPIQYFVPDVLPSWFICADCETIQTQTGALQNAATKDRIETMERIKAVANTRKPKAERVIDFLPSWEQFVINVANAGDTPTGEVDILRKGIDFDTQLTIAHKAGSKRPSTVGQAVATRLIGTPDKPGLLTSLGFQVGQVVANHTDDSVALRIYAPLDVRVRLVEAMEAALEASKVEATEATEVEASN